MNLFCMIKQQQEKAVCMLGSIWEYANKSSYHDEIETYSTWKKTKILKTNERKNDVETMNGEEQSSIIDIRLKTGLVNIDDKVRKHKTTNEFILVELLSRNNGTDKFRAEALDIKTLGVDR